MTVPQRIVSLLPSSTEILYALGVEARVVGVSHQCDYPTAVLQRPRVTAAPISSHRGEAEQDTCPILQAGLSPYPLDLALLRQLQPEVIITQVPGATGTAVPAALLETTRRFLGTHVDVLSLQPAFLQDIWDDIHVLGEVTGQQRQASTILEALFARVQTLMAESIILQQPPRVAVLSQCEPLQLAGYWLPDMIRIAGGNDGLNTAGAPGAEIRWQQLLDYAPEVLLVMPYDASLEQTRAMLPTLQAFPGWHDLPAVQQGQAYAVDGRASLYRPGPRIVDSLELLAGLIHPDLFGEWTETHRQVHHRLPG